MKREDIRAMAVKHGFKLRAMAEDGSPDLHEYVYEFAEALLARNQHLYRKTELRVRQLEEELGTNRTYCEGLREQIKQLAEGSLK